MSDKSKAKILVVDDERDIREYLRHVLELSDFDVIEADSGESALYALVCNPDIVLIVLDWMMPGISGLEVLEQLRNEYELIPVLMLSARTDHKDIIQALEYGATDYVLKPLEREHFLFKINGLLERKRASARMHASRRKTVNFNAHTPFTITGVSPKEIIFETSFPIAPGELTVMSSPVFSRCVEASHDTRYSLKVSECNPCGRKFKITASFLSLSPLISSKIKEAVNRGKFIQVGSSNSLE